MNKDCRDPLDHKANVAHRVVLVNRADKVSRVSVVPLDQRDPLDKRDHLVNRDPLDLWDLKVNVDHAVTTGSPALTARMADLENEARKDELDRLDRLGYLDLRDQMVNRALLDKLATLVDRVAQDHVVHLVFLGKMVKLVNRVKEDLLVRPDKEVCTVIHVSFCFIHGVWWRVGVQIIFAKT